MYRHWIPIVEQSGTFRRVALTASLCASRRRNYGSNHTTTGGVVVHPLPAASGDPTLSVYHTPSYSSGPSTTPLLGLTIGEALIKASMDYATSDALVVKHQNVRWSYAELARRVDELASALLSLGLRPGARIGVWGPNCLEWVLAQFATARVGFILVTINPAYRPRELEFALNKVGCEALVMAKGVKNSDFVDILHQIAPELAHCKPSELHAKRIPSLRHVILMDAATDGNGCTRTSGSVATTNLSGFHSFRDLCFGGNALSRYALQEIAHDVMFDDPVNIQYTSGTTGLPKGATLTHHNIINNGFFVGERIGLTENDRVCIPVPLYHCFGMVMGNLACLTHGAAMVYPSESFDAERTLSAVQEERCTALYGVPSMFISMLSHPTFETYALNSLRTGIMAGSPCPKEIMQAVTTKMFLSEMTIAYGMTETSPVSTQSTTSDPLDLRVSTVGRVHPHVEVKIIGSSGKVVARGETGELCTRGYSVMHGYWGEEAKTKESIDDCGWMHSGDLATMDDDGYIRIVGRLKDMIIRGGENIYPREIEEFLHTHPDIMEAYVFGVADARMGEEVCAWVRIAPHASSLTAEDIQQFCKGNLAHYKIPKYIRKVNEFPMTVSGKAQKYKMREEEMEKKKAAAAAER